MAETLFATATVPFLLATSGPDTGPEELVTYWPDAIRVGWFLFGFLGVVVVGRLLIQPLVTRLVRRRNRNNPTLQAAIVVYFRLLVVLVATLVGVVVAGYGQLLGGSALVFSAMALAVGIAAQEVVGSLVSGMALVMDPEFNVGDYIEWEGGEGVVRAIALRVTRVETADGELVTIPNTILTSHEIIRPYGNGNHRIAHEIGIAYDDASARALGHLEAVATETDGILAEPAPVAYLDELGDDEVTLSVYYWISDANRHEILTVRSAYARAAKNRLESDGFTVSPAAERNLQGRLSIDGIGRS